MSKQNHKQIESSSFQLTIFVASFLYEDPVVLVNDNTRTVRGNVVHEKHSKHRLDGTLAATTSWRRLCCLFS